MISSSETETFTGEDCGSIFLIKLCEKFPNRNAILIAHNCGYDFRFIHQHLTMFSLCERGHFLLEAKGIFTNPYNKNQKLKITLKDSYAVIAMPLSKFAKCFNLPQEKEIIPYKLYTKKNILKRYLPLELCKSYTDFQVRSNNLDKIPSTKDYDDFFNKFIDNATKWKCINTDGLEETFKIDIIKYSQIYCERDVQVLKHGYETFGKMLKETCNMNIINYMSAAQLANDYMAINGVFEGVNKLSSKPRDYIMKCMVGGRTMTRNNEKQYVKDILQDFDCTSLYPSAMLRLGGYLKGSPKVLTEDLLNYEFLQKCDGYFIQIKINKVNKNYNFPLSSYINKHGVRIFTNNPEKNIYVCKFQLEDLIEFQEIEFDIIDGYYYNEGRNNKLSEVIKFVFEERVKLKESKNPLQEIYKLIMNCSYGKTLQKAHPEKIVFKTEFNAEDFISKNYNYITSYQELYNGNSEFKKYIIKTTSGIEDHYNNVHCGVEVLSMSKRIMNEVMCLAENNNIDIYYQDTDSMHLKEKDIPLLSELFEQKYNRVLIGKGMGQFHSDFDSNILTKNSIKAIESIFLGKKCYIDKLEGIDREGNIAYDYHIRMKGISNNSIIYKSVQENLDLIELYKSLYEGNSHTFDLCCGGLKLQFENNENYTIKSKHKFERKIKF